MEKKNFSTKTEMVYEQIKENIVNGLIEQGEKIIAREYAKEFGVSDIPVREALKKLESEGLVENVPHVGTRVCKIDIQKAKEIFAVRLELEAYATRLAAETADENGIEELQKLINDLNQALGKADIKKVSRLNTAFHKKLYELSGNSLLCEMIDSLMDRSQYSRSVFTLIPDRKEKSNQEHQMIVDALRKRNPEEAERALRVQKEYAFDALLNKLKAEMEGKRS